MNTRDAKKWVYVPDVENILPRPTSINVWIVKNTQRQNYVRSKRKIRKRLLSIMGVNANAVMKPKSNSLRLIIKTAMVQHIEN